MECSGRPETGAEKKKRKEAEKKLAKKAKEAERKAATPTKMEKEDKVPDIRDYSRVEGDGPTLQETPAPVVSTMAEAPKKKKRAPKKSGGNDAVDEQALLDLAIAENASAPRAPGVSTIVQSQTSAADEDNKARLATAIAVRQRRSKKKKASAGTPLVTPLAPLPSSAASLEELCAQAAALEADELTTAHAVEAGDGGGGRASENRGDEALARCALLAEQATQLMLKLDGVGTCGEAARRALRKSAVERLDALTERMATRAAEEFLHWANTAPAASDSAGTKS